MKRQTESERFIRTLSRKWWRGRLLHIILSLLTALTLLLTALLVFLYTVFCGPSKAISDRVISSMNETSALKLVPYLFMPKDEVDAALDRTSFVALETVTDTGLYHFQASGAGEFSVTAGSDLAVVRAEDRSEPGEEPHSTEPEVRDDPYGVGEGIEIIRITGPTYKGYLAIIEDPSRVFVGVSSDFRHGEPGKRVDEICEKYGAILAVNGGAFEDTGGNGNGGSPTGLVYSEGIMYRGSTKGATVAGFDQEHRLIVGNLTTQEAQRYGFRDAVGFGPALIIDGVPARSSGSNASLNPRTAIGQRADGAVLLLVVDGRQMDSLGASFGDLIEVMLEYGAINACNLDGGSSSVLYANGQQLNDGVAVTGSRNIPTAILVRRGGEV